jgi:hypothetical protein
MPYKNLLWAKLEKRLLNDYRFYSLSEKCQLTYVKLIMGAVETSNKLPKTTSVLKELLRYKGTEEELKTDIEDIKKNFPKFKESSSYYYFYEWKNRVNPTVKSGHPK